MYFFNRQFFCLNLAAIAENNDIYIEPLIDLLLEKPKPDF
jgi:hypothetical protein